MPSLVQKDLLASKLVGPDSDLPKAARPNSEVLCEIAKCQLCKVAMAEPGLQLYDTARPRPRPDRPDRSEFILSETGWLDSASEQPAKIQPCQARPRPDQPDRSEAIYLLPEAVRSPLRTRGQWVLGSSGSNCTALEQDAVGLRTPIATVQVLCATPRAEDSKAGHLLELVRIQVVTRREARQAVLSESPLVDKTAQDLLSKITELQRTNPLCL